LSNDNDTRQKSVEQSQKLIASLTTEVVDTYTNDRLLNFYEWQGVIDATETSVNRVTEQETSQQ
jgi:predicted transcriptional regulator